VSALWVIALIGPAMGSFAALLADRLPRGEGVVAARSRCRSCRTPLAPRDLVPLLSFAVLRGRCRHCGTAIPAWVWQAELAGLGLGVLAVALAEDWMQAGVSALWLWCLLALTLCDLRAFRLPDVLTLALLVLGIGVAWPDWPAAALGAVLGAGTFLALRLGYHALTGREGMGMGDVKLMAGIGAGLGAEALPMVALIAAGSALLAAGLGTVRAAFRVAAGPRGGSRRRVRRLAAVPFGAWLSVAAMAVWVVQRVP
jgi:leader peptidase (prepilin peptidase) / N-methyltransferase